MVSKANSAVRRTKWGDWKSKLISARAKWLVELLLLKSKQARNYQFGKPQKPKLLQYNKFRHLNDRRVGSSKVYRGRWETQPELFRWNFFKQPIWRISQCLIRRWSIKRVQHSLHTRKFTKRFENISKRWRLLMPLRSFDLATLMARNKAKVQAQRHICKAAAKDD